MRALRCTIDGAVGQRRRWSQALTEVPGRHRGGTASGRTLRVRGRGVPGKGKAGDLLVTLEVAVPVRLTAAERKVIESLAEEMDDDPRPQITAAVQAGGDK